MGHRALLAYQEPDMSFTTRYSHWGAHGAKLLESDWEPRKGGGGTFSLRSGKREVETGLANLKEVGQSVDFLYHECFYYFPLGGEARAFDTVWWRGGNPQHSTAPPGVGAGALVELEDTGEWQNFSTRVFENDGDVFSDDDRPPQIDSEDMTAREFHKVVKSQEWSDRIPDWSPIGGDELRVPDKYVKDTDAE